MPIEKVRKKSAVGLLLISILVAGVFGSVGKAQATSINTLAYPNGLDTDQGIAAAEPSAWNPSDGTSSSIPIPTLGDWQAGIIAFSHGSEGEWDTYLWGGFANSLIKRDNTYFLYYQGSPSYDDQCDSVSYRGIGLATSTDGIHWTKSDHNPVLSWYSQGSIEEGAASSAAWVGQDGRIYVYYGANTGSGCLVNSSARLAVSEDGERFQDLGEVLSGNDPNVWGSGDEIFPVGAYSYENQWYLYYIPNGVTLSRKLGVATGDTYDNFTQTTGINDASMDSWGPVSIILGGSDSVLFTNPGGMGGPVNIYRFSANDPTFVNLHDSYTLPDCAQSSVIYESNEDRWLMSCRNTDASNYQIRYTGNLAEATATRTATNTGTRTPTPTPTDTGTSTSSPTLAPTTTATWTSTPSATPTPTMTATQTPTVTPTKTASQTATPVATWTSTPSPTPTPTMTATQASTVTPTLTLKPTSTDTATLTPTTTATFTFTPTPTNTPTYTPTATPTAAYTPTYAPTPSSTPTPMLTNLAVNKVAYVSSYQDTSHTGDMALDASLGTCWMSKKASGRKVSASEWIVVDLGAMATITSVKLDWDTNYATSYVLQSSTDNSNWTTFYLTSIGNGGSDTVLVSDRLARYIKLESTAWNDPALRNWLREIEIMGYYSTSVASPTPISTPTTDLSTPTQTQDVTISVHVGDIEGTADKMGVNWRGNVVIEVHDNNHNPVSNASVNGTWSGGYSGIGMCITDETGSCMITSGKGVSGSTSMMFTVDSVTWNSARYSPEYNHDPDNDSNGTSITIHKP